MKTKKWSPLVNETKTPLDVLSPTEEQPQEVVKAPKIDPTFDEGVPHKEESVSSPPPNLPVGLQSRPIDLLEGCANIILSQLPSSTREFVEEVADIVLKIPRWELVAGSLLAQHTQGSLTSPELDPAWRDPILAEAEGTCEYKPCGRTFAPERRGQKFCSNVCGGKQAKLELDAKLEKQKEELRTKIIDYIQEMKNEIIKNGGKPTQIILAANVYQQIGKALEDKNVVLGLKIKVDMGAPDDRIYISA